MSNLDMSKLLSALSKMDKSELEAGLAKANEILKNKDAKDIMNNINKNK